MNFPNKTRESNFLPNLSTINKSQGKKIGSNDEKNSKLHRKMLPITSNFYKNMNDINEEINAFDVMRKHYYGEDFELSKKKIQQVLKHENVFFCEDENSKNSLKMKYMYYPNVGLSTSQSLMRAMSVSSFLRNNNKTYNAPDRSKFEKKLFLKDLMKLIMFDLKHNENSPDKKPSNVDEKKIEELMKKSYEEMRRISLFSKTRKINAKDDLDDFESIDLMRELRQKMLKEFQTSSKDLTEEQKKIKILEIRDQFIPEKRKKLLEAKMNRQKVLKKHEMTSKKSINNVYYQIIAMNKKDREKFKSRIAMSSSSHSRFMEV